MKRTLTVTVTLLAVTASGALAQRGRLPRDQGPQMRERGPAAMMAGSRGQGVFSPGRLLANQSRLELTDDQVSQLTDLRGAAVTAQQQGRASLVSQRAQMAEALAADNPDPQVVRQHYDAAQSALHELGWVGVNNALQARALLTDEQQTAARERTARSRRDRGPRQQGPRARKFRRR